MGWMNLFGCLCSSSKKQKTPGNSRDAAAIAADVPELTLRELKEATAKFSASRLIGRGAYAEVFRASLRGGRAAAAKRHVVAPNDEHVPDLGLLRQRVAAASRLRHPNVVRLLGYTITADVRVLLYELADVGTLHDVLHGPRGTPAPEPGSSMPPAAALRLSWEQRVRIALDAARGLAYMHGASVAHHDVRPSNVLLFQGVRAKIADHNVFKELAPAPPERDEHTVIFPEHVSRLFQYHSPEYNTTGRSSHRSDVFSFGLVLLELLTGRTPCDRTLPPDQQVLKHWAIPLLVEGRIGECIDPDLGDQYPPAGALKLGRIAVQCLEGSPTSRPSMETVSRLINSDVVFARG